MPATKRLVLDLPEETVDLIEARVAAGEYATASDLVLDSLGTESHDDASGEWVEFAGRVRETVRRLDSGEEPTFTSEEVKAHLDERRRARLPAGA